MQEILPLIDPGRRFIIFWTPRSGSTTLWFWFFHAIGFGEQMRSVSPHALRHKWQAETRPSPEDLQRLYEDPSVERIVLARDPFERAVSAFYLALTSPATSQWGSIKEIRPDASDEQRLSFIGFLDYLAEIDLATCNLHWRLQSAQDWWQQRLRVDRFMRVESLSDDLARLGSDHGIKAPIKVTSKTPRVDQNARPDLPELDLAGLRQALPLDERGRLSFPDHHAFLSAPAVTKIQTLYGRDFEALAYPAMP